MPPPAYVPAPTPTQLVVQTPVRTAAVSSAPFRTPANSVPTPSDLAGTSYLPTPSPQANSVVPMNPRSHVRTVLFQTPSELPLKHLTVKQIIEKWGKETFLVELLKNLRLWPDTPGKYLECNDLLEMMMKLDDQTVSTNTHRHRQLVLNLTDSMYETFQRKRPQ